MYGLTVTLKVLELICLTLPWIHVMAAHTAAHQLGRWEGRSHAEHAPAPHSCSSLTPATLPGEPTGCVPVPVQLA